MDQTYMINKPDCSFDENLFELYLYNDEVAEKQHIKQRLSELRERSRKMLKKHNWQRFFSNVPVETKKASHFERHLLADNEHIITDDESSFVSTIEFSFLMMDDTNKEQAIPFQLKESNSEKIMETPLLQRRSNRLTSYLNIKKKKLDMNDSLGFEDEYCHSSKKQKMARQQSLTFIADLASASTPTRISEQMTSTPKNHSHNPLKYHPTQTIRNKRSKKQQKSRSTKPMNLSSQLNKLQDNIIISQVNINLSCSKCQKCSTVASQNIVDHSTPCVTRRELNKNHLVNFKNQMKRLDPIVDVKRSLKSKKSIVRTSSKIEVRKQQNSKFEIPLEDLLYTPRKLKSSSSFKSSNAVKLSKRISTTPTVFTSKVYFL